MKFRTAALVAVMGLLMAGCVVHPIGHGHHGGGYYGHKHYNGHHHGHSGHRHHRGWH